jgi:hypothetical protein
MLIERWRRRQRDRRSGAAIPYLKISSAITYTLCVQVMSAGIAMATEPQIQTS